MKKTPKIKTPKIKSPKPFVPELFWCIHHEVPIEFSCEPIENRIRFIKSTKARWQWKTRFKNLKRVKSPDLLPKKILELLNKAVRRVKDDQYFGMSRDFSWHGSLNEFSNEMDRLLLSAHASYLVRNEPNVRYHGLWRKLRLRHRREYPNHDFDYEHSELRFPGAH